jgi:hypothetical protein
MPTKQRNKTPLATLSRRLKLVETGFIGGCRASGIPGGAEGGGDDEMPRFAIMMELPSW